MLLIALFSATRASAFTSADCTTAMNAYNNAFYVVNGSGIGYYKNSNSGTTVSGFWTYAEEIEMIVDAYKQTGNSTYKGMISQLCNGFTNYNGTSWSYDTYNDDCIWAVIAFVRAYTQTGNSTYLNIAKANFDMVYARAWDTTLGGGLWWTTAKGSKNACVNGPAAIAAYRLYQALGDSSYLTKSQAIHNWMVATIYNTSNGNVWDHIDADGTVTKTAITYNEGTFIGGAYYLGDTSNMALTENYVYTNWPGSDMQLFGQDSDAGGFNGICLRWMGIAGYNTSYRQAVANQAWSVRNSANLSWNSWNTATPSSGTLYSWDCSSTIVAMMCVPPG